MILIWLVDQTINSSARSVRVAQHTLCNIMYSPSIFTRIISSALCASEIIQVNILRLVHYDTLNRRNNNGSRQRISNFVTFTAPKKGEKTAFTFICPLNRDYLAPGGVCEVLFSPCLSVCVSVCLCVRLSGQYFGILFIGY